MVITLMFWYGGRLERCSFVIILSSLATPFTLQHLFLHPFSKNVPLAMSVEIHFYIYRISDAKIIRKTIILISNYIQ